MNKNIIKLLSNENIDYNTKHGAEIYRRSLIILMQCAIQELYPDLRVQIGQTLMHGYYFEPRSGKQLYEDFIRNVKKRMKYIVSLDEKFTKRTLTKPEAIKLYKKNKREDKVRTISYLPYNTIYMVFIRNYFDFTLTKCVASTKFLPTFNLIRYKKGFILQFPVRGNMMKLPHDPHRQRNLFKVYLETREWNRILGIHHVSDLNKAIDAGTISTLIKVQEAFHEKKIARIADSIKVFYPQKKLIFVAGPSASGKTTFLKRIAIQLMANGLKPEAIHLDNYFVPREKTPVMDNGERDFETIKVLDIKFFRKQINDLKNGSEVMLPKYNFKTGKREKSGKKLKLKFNSIILVEGIHALNPEISSGIDEESIYKIFVSALTQLLIDSDTRIFTSDSRLMRRLIRDSLFRSYGAAETIKRFPLVRKGESKYIFPFQDNADVFFNSSLIYEQAVLKPFIEPLLKNLKTGKGSSEYFEAQRILKYLDFFLPVSAKEVPQVSIIREFIGKSGFNY